MKVHLLQAELFSCQHRNDKAQASYVDAINSACSSGFIHEQGLACELAGYHWRKVGDIHKARAFFEQAKQCYMAWGSHMKVVSVTQQINSTPGNVTLV
jgi:ATP-dependent RNA helicase DDX31/DBP7